MSLAYFANTITKIAKNLLADIIVFMEDKAKKAEELFLSGYNCAQSVFCAFCEDFGIDFEVGLKMTSSMGGGMGRLREVCGAVSAMFMIAGISKGYSEPANDELKAKHYELIQNLASMFKSKYNTIICRELLELPFSGADSPIPSRRTEQYYKERPCEHFIRYAAEIIETQLLNNRSESFIVEVKSHKD